VGWVRRGRRRAVAAVVCGTALVPLWTAAPAAARDGALGIDVSEYQRRIDWSAVGTGRIRFAFLRATLGNRHLDRWYRRNVAGATRHGIVVGAYHYAKPGPARWDARAEARHFLRVARNAPGDLLPVLDVEESGGLGEARLRSWVRGWLRHVEDRTGLRPMIYSSSSFWRDRMGNTTWFARRGHPHWVAHWHARRPDVPARRWAGRGWTVWQWSASGRVRGIRGPVDLDRFDGRDFARASIAAVAVRPPEDGAVLGPGLACGGSGPRCERLADPGSTLTLRADAAPGARFVRWTGACAAAGAAPTCRLVARGRLDLSATFERSPAALDSPRPARGGHR
jgi:GH25 family lysozyme M1 (1,4-beta-N-acetylmuramidase)